MNLEIFEVETKRDLRNFIKLPAQIHQHHKNWVPPIYSDDYLFFNKNKNRSFEHSDTIMLLASNGKQLIGRIMGIINRKYNELHNEKDARFCFLETYDDKTVAHRLIEEVQKWAVSKGMENMVGPLGFSDKDPQGLLIEGFNEPNVIATNFNYEYMIDIIEQAGFTKKTDLVVYKLVLPDEVPDFYKRIYARALSINKDKSIIEFTTRKQIKPYIIPVLELMNKTYQKIYAYSPLDEKEMLEFAKRYLPILDPRFIKVAVNKDGEIVAFVISMPDISEGIKKSKGKLFPFGIFQILLSQRKTKQLNLLLGAVRQDQRDKGLDTILGLKIFEEIYKSRIEYIDSHLILESNTKMRAELERLGGTIYKRYRIYEKKI
jgi:hypothetical protein